MTFTLLNAAAQAAAPVEATGVFSWAWLMIAIPAASSALLLVLGRRSDRWGHLLATLASWAAFAVGYCHNALPSCPRTANRASSVLVDSRGRLLR